MPKLFYWPVSPVVINQKFGENKACVDLATGTKYITCDGLNPPDGYKSLYSQMLGHNALDLQANNWQPVYSAREGMVIEKQTNEQRGLGIGVLHGPYDSKYYVTRYWHLAAIDVDIGQKVNTGDFLGYADNTGYSSGNHLHFEVHESDQFGNSLNTNNGYFGAIDPAPLMFDQFARDVSTLHSLVEQLALLVDKLADLLRNR